MRKLKLIGRRSGRLVVLSYKGMKKSGYVRHSMWLCKCDCGGKKIIRGSRLDGSTRSCGCLNKEISQRMASTINYRHGKSGSKEHRAWLYMRRRCYQRTHRSYKNYGGRGIRVCKRWLNNFNNFFADVGPAPSRKHSIDRMRNNEDYKPSNVRWATRKQQDLNRRKKRCTT